MDRSYLFNVYLSKPGTLLLQMWCLWRSFSDMLMNVHKAWFELGQKVVRYLNLLTFSTASITKRLNY